MDNNIKSSIDMDTYFTHDNKNLKIDELPELLSGMLCCLFDINIVHIISHNAKIGIPSFTVTGLDHLTKVTILLTDNNWKIQKQVTMSYNTKNFINEIHKILSSQYGVHEK